MFVSWSALSLHIIYNISAHHFGSWALESQCFFCPLDTAIAKNLVKNGSTAITTALSTLIRTNICHTQRLPCCYGEGGLDFWEEGLCWMLKFPYPPRVLELSYLFYCAVTVSKPHKALPPPETNLYWLTCIHTRTPQWESAANISA